MSDQPQRAKMPSEASAATAPRYMLDTYRD
jgi:hypothetical protein